MNVWSFVAPSKHFGTPDTVLDGLAPACVELQAVINISMVETDFMAPCEDVAHHVEAVLRTGILRVFARF